jgi:hypothetical protein
MCFGFGKLVANKKGLNQLGAIQKTKFKRVQGSG